jgi:hypothetical protein
MTKLVDVMPKSCGPYTRFSDDNVFSDAFVEPLVGFYWFSYSAHSVRRREI